MYECVPDVEKVWQELFIKIREDNEDEFLLDCSRGNMPKDRSPIESMLAIALFYCFQSGYMGATVQSNAKVGPYYPDFLITTPYMHLIVECDGHDYHERTKDQAIHDKKRDRFFTLGGYKILRFTGSEINKDPWACAEQVSELVEKVTHEARKREANAIHKPRP